jgi:hypothetical protein
MQVYLTFSKIKMTSKNAADHKRIFVRTFFYSVFVQKSGKLVIIREKLSKKSGR